MVGVLNLFFTRPLLRPPLPKCRVAVRMQCCGPSTRSLAFSLLPLNPGVSRPSCTAYYGPRHVARPGRSYSQSRISTRVGLALPRGNAGLRGSVMTVRGMAERAPCASAGVVSVAPPPAWRRNSRHVAAVVAGVVLLWRSGLGSAPSGAAVFASVAGSMSGACLNRMQLNGLVMDGVDGGVRLLRTGLTGWESHSDAVGQRDHTVDFTRRPTTNETLMLFSCLAVGGGRLHQTAGRHCCRQRR